MVKHMVTSVLVVKLSFAALTSGVAGFEARPDPTNAPAEEKVDPSFRGETHQSEEITIGAEERGFRRNHSPVRERTNRNAPSSEPTCPPQEYRWGRYSTTVLECGFVPPGEWTPWFENEEGAEGEEEEGTPPQVIVVTREDVQTLIVNPGNLIVQPDRPWVLVNTDTVVMTDATEHVLRTRVLDLDIDVRVTPVLYTWDFGDGSAPLTGTDPGAPWPNHTVSHVYGDATTVTISLRTEWDAAFRVEGTSTWIPVTGRAVTTQSTDPIEVVTATPRLTTG